MRSKCASQVTYLSKRFGVAGGKYRFPIGVPLAEEVGVGRAELPGDLGQLLDLVVALEQRLAVHELADNAAG